MAAIDKVLVPGAANSLSLFNRVRMGYAVIESSKLTDWQTLLGKALGMQADTLPDGSCSGRMDDHERRLLVVPGKSEDLVVLGLELADQEALCVASARLRQHGIELREGTPENALRRGVQHYWQFKGPKGLTIELFHEPRLLQPPPRMASSGFVTGDKGFGHVAITTRRPELMKQFWQDIFDIRHSDDVHYSIGGVPLIFEFFRFNERHHSIALAYTPKVRVDPIRTRIQHLEIQAATLDDLTAAYQRCGKLGVPISMDVGQHANDRAMSFYVRTPSGFDMEYGWNPIGVNERTWHPELWDRISFWGHEPASRPLERIGQLGRSVASLTRTEFMPAGF
jgi:2,3-dihydroxybiphenyl 1,2-dioxygenase